MTVQYLALHAGFVRDAKMSSRADPAVIVKANQHPCVMFEVIAQDQARAKAFYSEVFGWSYQTGTGGFAYVHFPSKIQSLLGGIGQANSSVPGFEPGHNFYILVDDMDAAIARAEAAGGKLHMEVANVDGYTFAMVEDPEGNPIGLIKPFDSPTQ
jgi:predicted enzyme related to lactoylglutathione lyase